LYIQNSDYSDLHRLGSLESIKTIQGELRIEYNDQLSKIGLGSLERVDSNISIDSNPMLQDLCCMSNLHTIDGPLGISNNNVLQQIDDLSGVSSLNGTLSIENNSQLGSTNMYSLTQVGTDTMSNDAHLTIRNNPWLNDLSGLSTIEDIEGDLTIDNNDGMTNIGLNSLGWIWGHIYIQDNDYLPRCQATTLAETLHGADWQNNATICNNAPNSCCDIPSCNNNYPCY
jgi:hypothetical protein